jgi:cytochrome b561
MSSSIAPSRYHIVSQLLHWLMAAILLYLIVFSSFEEATDAQLVEKIKLHTGLGILIVLLAALRWIWRLARPRPGEIANTPRWQIRAANFTHHAFYIIFLIAPALGFVLAGLVAYRVEMFGLFEISGWLADSPNAAGLVNSFHGFAVDILTGLIVVHVAAALYHHFIKGDGLIWRMLPFGSGSQQ